MPYKDRQKRLAYNRAYNKQHYANNREKYLEKVKRRRRKIKSLYEEYKRTLSCTDCGLSGEEHTWLIDFDHREPSKKSRTISRMVSDATAWERIKEEIEKCDPVCANCHRIREHRRFKKRGRQNPKNTNPKAFEDNQRRRRVLKRRKEEELKKEYPNGGRSGPPSTNRHNRPLNQDVRERMGLDEEE